jgi:hypothetical protein
MTPQTKIAAAALAMAAFLSLEGCGHDQVDLSGVKIGMTHDQVVAVAPPGSTLYCRGDGDAQFETTARLPPSTSSTYCTWAAGSIGSLSVTPVMIGETASIEAKLLFGPDDRLISYAVGTPTNAYNAVVKSLQDKLGSPDSRLGMSGPTWTEKDGTLEVSEAGIGSADAMTLLLLKSPRAAAGG